jgi:hypothetical protein
MLTKVAWVESPLQLLNVVEYAHMDGDKVLILVRAGVSTLDRVADALRQHLPPCVELSTGWESALQSPMRKARVVVIGDAYSGQMRALMALGKARQVTLVDDGAIMLALADQLAAGVPLDRGVTTESRAQRALGALSTRRFSRLLTRGRLDLFTAYDQAPAVATLATRGARVAMNHYEWTRQTPINIPQPLSGHVVVGSAMVADGLIDAGLYSQWVASTAVDGPITYVAHRREEEDVLAQYAEFPGVVIGTAGLPIELTLAHSPLVTRVTTLPSSVIATLSRILPKSARFEIVGVPDAWWTAKASGDFKTLLQQIQEGVAS